MSRYQNAMGTLAVLLAKARAPIGSYEHAETFDTSPIHSSALERMWRVIARRLGGHHTSPSERRMVMTREARISGGSHPSRDVVATRAESIARHHAAPMRRFH